MRKRIWIKEVCSNCKRVLRIYDMRTGETWVEPHKGDLFAEEYVMSFLCDECN